MQNPKICFFQEQKEDLKKDLAVKGLDESLVQNRNAWRRAIHPKSRSGRDNGVVQPSDTENNAR